MASRHGVVIRLLHRDRRRLRRRHGAAETPGGQDRHQQCPADRPDAGRTGRESLAEIHVCGLGVQADWDQVAKYAGQLRKKGVEILWYCGRGYLDADRYRQICTPVFLQAASNTEAVCRHFQLEKHAHAADLMDLALHDPWIQGGRKKPAAGRSPLARADRRLPGRVLQVQRP